MKFNEIKYNYFIVIINFSEDDRGPAERNRLWKVDHFAVQRHNQTAK